VDVEGNDGTKAYLVKFINFAFVYYISFANEHRYT